MMTLIYITMTGMRPGDPNSDNYDDMMSQIGIRTYSMNAEKIIDIVQNVQKGNNIAITNSTNIS